MPMKASLSCGAVPIRPKNQGRGLMVSDFVTEFDGLLQLSIKEYRRAAESDPSIRMCAREILKFGSGSEGYWNNARFLKQMEMAIKIADIKYPSDKYSKVWVFDQSSGHCAFREDALHVTRMNVGSGGAQPRMRDTIWDGRVQIMVLADGWPKGMRIILQERGIDTTRMKAADMRLVLGNHADFKHEHLNIWCKRKDSVLLRKTNLLDFHIKRLFLREDVAPDHKLRQKRSAPSQSNALVSDHSPPTSVAVESSSANASVSIPAHRTSKPALHSGTLQSQHRSSSVPSSDARRSASPAALSPSPASIASSSTTIQGSDGSHNGSA